MGATLRREHGGYNLMLRGVVDIFEARELHRLALEALQAPEEVTVHLDETTRLDTATSQLLLALKLALAERGKRFIIKAQPAQVKETWRLLGIEHALE
jgi:anti-anti-sigma regulatory factor